jgi:hypothetical protein
MSDHRAPRQSGAASEVAEPQGAQNHHGKGHAGAQDQQHRVITEARSCFNGCLDFASYFVSHDRLLREPLPPEANAGRAAAVPALASSEDPQRNAFPIQQ